MCEIALVVVGQTNPDDIYQDCKRYKAGDVIEVVADGWPWGAVDLTNPNWRIIKFPGIDVSQFTQFLSSQIPTDPNNPSKTLLRRALRFAWSQIANTNWAANHPGQMTALQNYIQDATRTNPTLTVPANTVAALVSEMSKYTVTKALVQDPAIVG
jgi:hypothetical protein